MPNYKTLGDGKPENEKQGNEMPEEKIPVYEMVDYKVQSFLTPEKEWDSLDKQKMTSFMNCFGSKETAALDKDALDYVRSDDMTGLSVMEPLYKMGMFGGPSTADCSVEGFVEQCKNIYIVGKDGKRTSYTERFLNNDVIEELIKKENDPEKGYKPKYGRTMMRHLGMMLSGHPLAAGALGEDESVIIAPPGKEPLILTSSENARTMEAFKADEKKILEISQTIEAEMSDAQKALEAKEAVASAQQREFAEMQQAPAPEVPPVPRERSGLRRFFCALGFPHSKQYKEDKAAFEAKALQKQQFEAALTEKKKAVEDAVGECEKMRNESAAKQKQYEDFQRKHEADLANLPPALANHYQHFGEIKKIQEREKEIAAEKEYMKHEGDRKEISEKINDPKSLKAMTDSKLPPFSKGSLKAAVEMAARPNRGLSEVRIRYMMDAMFDVDTAGKTMQKYNTLKEAEKKKFLNNIVTEYGGRCNESKKLFEEVFGERCTPASVDKVVTTVNLQKLVDNRVDTADKPKLPRITPDNYLDMTYLLMTGLKTLVVEQLNIDPTQKQNVEKAKDGQVKEISQEEGKRLYEEQLLKNPQDHQLAVRKPRQHGM